MNAASSPMVALVDDDEDLLAATAQLLTIEGITVLSYSDAAAALAAVDADFPGVVVTDVRMPGMSGIELFRLLRERDAELPVLLITGHGEVATAVNALKAGAWDFLTKPFDADVLVAAVTRALMARALVLDNRMLRARSEATAADDLIGETAQIRQLRAMIPVLADATLDLTIEGATGTGKAHYARLVHRAGRRSRHRFLTVDCAVLPQAVAERELFSRSGLIAQADRGTLFLDNLHLASAELQHGLARFVDTRAVALDTRAPDSVDVRIIASFAEGQAGAIEPTLFHRLAGVPLRIPPLAERREDIPLLFARFVKEAAQRHKCNVPDWTLRAHELTVRDWPGNVWELDKAAERFCLGLETLTSTKPASTMSLPARIDAFERSAIEDAIFATGGEIATAIGLLQIPRKTFYYRANRLGIDLSALRQKARH